MTRTGVRALISSRTGRSGRFYLNLRPRARPPLAVVSGGWEVCSADGAVEREGSPFLGIEFVAAGAGELLLAGTSHELAAGSLFSRGPGISQRLVVDPRRSLVKYSVDFTGRRGRALLRESRLDPGTLVQVTRHGDMRERFERIVALGLDPGATAERACAVELELILLSLASEPCPPEMETMRAFATFERCRSYIDQHFLTLSSAEEIAVGCNLNISYLCRLFQRSGEVPPYHYLQRLQMQWAAARLREERLKVKEVADGLGLDSFQFSRTFKRLHGVSPRNFAREGA